MPDLNDFHAFKSTSGGSRDGGGGLSGGCLPWLMGILAILVIIGTLTG